MIIKTSIAVEGLNGSAGGVTAARNKGRAYFKVRTAPRNPQTVSQTEMRSILTSLSKQYQTIGAGEITAWNEFAKSQIGRRVLGEAGKLSGINAFLRVNANLTLIGKPTVTTPPASANFNPIEVIGVFGTVIGESGTIAGAVLAFKTAPILANQTIVIRATPILSKGALAKTTKLRVVGTYTETVPAGEDEDVPAGSPLVNFWEGWTERFWPNPNRSTLPDGLLQVEVYVIDNATGLSSNKVFWSGEIL